MQQVTKDNWLLALQRMGFTVSKCGHCGLPLHKCHLKNIHDRMIEIRPTHTVNGSFVIKKNGAAVASGYIYDLHKYLPTYFPTAVEV